MSTRRKLLYVFLAASLLLNVVCLSAILYVKAPPVHDAVMPYYKAVRFAILKPTPTPPKVKTFPALDSLPPPHMPFPPEFRLSLGDKVIDPATFDREGWRSDVLNQARSLLELPAIGAPKNVVRSEPVAHDGYTVERITLASPMGRDQIVVYKVMPDAARLAGAKPPVILAIPGTGDHSVQGLLGEVDDYHKAAAIKFAEQGYASYIVETFAVGERAFDVGWIGEQSDWEMGKWGLYTGEYLLTIMISDLLQVVELIKTEPDVDTSRLATFGVSRGGFLSMWTALFSPDVKGAVIASGISDGDDYREVGFNQDVLPQEGRFFNRSDLTGAIAPRPILISYATGETQKESITYRFEAATGRTVNRVKAIYRLFDAEDNVHVSIHDLGHTWDQTATLDFLKELFAQ